MLLLKPALHHPQLLKTASQKWTESSNDQVQFTVTHFQHLALASTMESHPLGGRRALLKKIQTTKKQKNLFRPTSQAHCSKFWGYIYSLSMFPTGNTFSQGQLLYGSQTGRPRPVPTGLRQTNVSSLREINKKWKYKNAFIHSSMKIRASNQQVSAEKQHKFSVIMEEPLVCASRQNNAVNGMIISWVISVFLCLWPPTLTDCALCDVQGWCVLSGFQTGKHTLP